MCKLEFQYIKLNKLKLLAGIFFFSQIAMAQTVSTLGLELGITFSQFPKREVMDPNMKIVINPLVGPLIGVSKKWILSKHFNLTSGIQYQMAGRRYHNYEQAYNLNSENLTIHKICVPIDLGYRFKMGNINPTFYLGVRPNIWLSAKRRISYGVAYAYVENLFDKIYGVDDYIPPKRLVCQFSSGLSSPLGKHLQISIDFNYGHNYYVAKYSPIGSHYSIAQKTLLTSSDYILNVVYFFNRSENKKSDSKNE